MSPTVVHYPLPPAIAALVDSIAAREAAGLVDRALARAIAIELRQAAIRAGVSEGASRSVAMLDLGIAAERLMHLLATPAPAQVPA